jgi:hypothetical protein
MTDEHLTFLARAVLMFGASRIPLWTPKLPGATL